MNNRSTFRNTYKGAREAAESSLAWSKQSPTRRHCDGLSFELLGADPCHVGSERDEVIVGPEVLRCVSQGVPAAPHGSFDKGPVALQRIWGVLQSFGVLTHGCDGHVLIMFRDRPNVPKSHAVERHCLQAQFDLVAGAEFLHPSVCECAAFISMSMSRDGRLTITQITRQQSASCGRLALLVFRH